MTEHWRGVHGICSSFSMFSSPKFFFMPLSWCHLHPNVFFPLYMPREKFTFRHEALTQKGRRLFAFSLSRSTHICICRASFFCVVPRTKRASLYVDILHLHIFGSGDVWQISEKEAKITRREITLASYVVCKKKKGEGKIDH